MTFSSSSSVCVCENIILHFVFALCWNAFDNIASYIFIYACNVTTWINISYFCEEEETFGGGVVVVCLPAIRSFVARQLLSLILIIVSADIKISQQTTFHDSARFKLKRCRCFFENFWRRETSWNVNYIPRSEQRSPFRGYLSKSERRKIHLPRGIILVINRTAGESQQ